LRNWRTSLFWSVHPALVRAPVVRASVLSKPCGSSALLDAALLQSAAHSADEKKPGTRKMNGRSCTSCSRGQVRSMGWKIWHARKDANGSDQ